MAQAPIDYFTTLRNTFQGVKKRDLFDNNIICVDDEVPGPGDHTVTIKWLPPNGGDKMILGMGRNRGKKMAKNDAAKEALKKLLALKVFEQKDVKYAHYQLPAN